MGPIMYQSTKYTRDQGPECLLIMSLPSLQVTFIPFSTKALDHIWNPGITSSASYL